MARSFGSLGEFFPDTDIRCRIRGCNNVWQFSGEDALRNVADGRVPRPERMCDDCFRIFNTLEDKHIPCANPGCDKTAVWNRFQQLEAKRQSRDERAPKLFCKDCFQKIRDEGDKEVPCRMKGCGNTWTWSARDRLLGDGAQPPRRLCDACYHRLNDLQDVQVPCRMKGCGNTWKWNRFQQLEHLIAGKSLESPPKRMCPTCFSQFRKKEDKRVPCWVTGCVRTWTWRAYEQLEQQLAEDNDAAPPERMCPECYTFYRQTSDIAVKCCNRGCARTWLFTRTMQLTLKVKGVERPPARMCDHCKARLQELHDRELKCAVPGCSRTWTYAAADQMRDELLGRAMPHDRRCAQCEAFLATHQAHVLTCESCGKEMQWSGYEQLLCELGTFSRPTRCVDCNEQVLALERPAEPEKLEHHLVVRVPVAGRWHADNVIRDRPKRMTHDLIGRMEHADLRIVCIGDELTYSLDDEELSWPYLLERRLETEFGEGQVAVLNAGIAVCNTVQGAMRFPRDVLPFEPHLVIFSFSLGDARLYRHRHEDGWHAELAPEEMTAAYERFAGRLGQTNGRAIYWTPHPIFPHDSGASPDGKENQRHAHWANAQKTALDQAIRVARQCCNRYEIPVLDVHARFEVNGTKSARKWMSTWYLHNEVGARNIATWFAQTILSDGLLPVDSHRTGVSASASS